MKTLCTVTAVIEIGAGPALLGLPSAVTALLLGTRLEPPAALTVARVAGNAQKNDVVAAAAKFVILVCWLATLFISFGLFAPANGTAVAALMVSALSASGALFLILELSLIEGDGDDKTRDRQPDGSCPNY